MLHDAARSNLPGVVLNQGLNWMFGHHNALGHNSGKHKRKCKYRPMHKEDYPDKGRVYREQYDSPNEQENKQAFYWYKGSRKKHVIDPVFWIRYHGARLRKLREEQDACII